MTLNIPPLTAPPSYCPQAEDTSVAADLLDFYLLRQKTASQRLQMAAVLMQGARKLSLHCLHQQFPHLSPSQFARKVAEAWLQEDCPPDYIPKSNEMTWIQDSSQLASQLHHLFVSIAIPYYITGGVAAIVYGEPRTTRDLDIVIAVARESIPQLVKADRSRTQWLLLGKFHLLDWL